MALVNPLFNHEGLAVLTYYNNNPITLESILYGVAKAGVMFVQSSSGFPATTSS